MKNSKKEEYSGRDTFKYSSGRNIFHSTRNRQYITDEYV